MRYFESLSQPGPFFVPFLAAKCHTKESASLILEMTTHQVALTVMLAKCRRSRETGRLAIGKKVIKITLKLERVLITIQFRRRWFAHHDCESTAFDFVPIARLLDSSSKRSVIASGASAAIFTSALASEVGSEEELRRLQGIFGF